MVVRQTDNDEVGEIADLLELSKLPYELRRAKRIRNLQSPAHGIGGEVGPQRFDGGAAPDLDRSSLAYEVLVVVEESRRAFLRRVPPMRHGDGEFAVVAQRLAVREDVVPNEARGRISQRVHAAIAHAVWITAGKTGERSLHVIGGHGAVGPLVAVGAEDAGTISIIQQDELTRQLMMVRRDLLAEDAQ